MRDTQRDRITDVDSFKWVASSTHAAFTFSPFLAFCDRVETYAMFDDCLNDDQQDFYMDDLESRRFLEELEGSAKGVEGFES